MAKRRPWRWVSLASVFVVGALLGVFLDRGWIQGMAPSCGGGFEEHPTEHSCVSSSMEVCNVFLKGASTDVEVCSVRSEDGFGHVSVAIEGTGGIRLVVRDPTTAALLDRNATLPANFEEELQGPGGQWILALSFRQAEGQGRAVLWG